MATTIQQRPAKDAQDAPETPSQHVLNALRDLDHASGRGFAVTRVALGLSVRQLAQALSLAPGTVRRYEASREAIEPALAARWRSALARVGAQRARSLRRQGFTESELALLGVSALLRPTPPPAATADLAAPDSGVADLAAGGAR